MNVEFNHGEAELIIEALNGLEFETETSDAETPEELESVEDEVTQAATRDELVDRLEELIEQDLATAVKKEDKNGDESG